MIACAGKSAFEYVVTRRAGLEYCQALQKSVEQRQQLDDAIERYEQEHHQSAFDATQHSLGFQLLRFEGTTDLIWIHRACTLWYIIVMTCVQHNSNRWWHQLAALPWKDLAEKRQIMKGAIEERYCAA